MLMCFPVDVDRRSVESDWISDEVTRAPIREDDAMFARMMLNTREAKVRKRKRSSAAR